MLFRSGRRGIIETHKKNSVWPSLYTLILNCSGKLGLEISQVYLWPVWMKEEMRESRVKLAKNKLILC